MGNRRGNGWKNYSKFSKEQIRQVLNDCEIQVGDETGSVFLCFCPFHSNYNSPALCVSKETGVFYCQNPSCHLLEYNNKTEKMEKVHTKGNIYKLMKLRQGLNYHEANRKLLVNQPEIDIVALIAESEVEREFPSYSEDYVDEQHAAFMKHKEAKAYFKSRGFDKQTALDFKVGYERIFDKKTNKVDEFITFPMRDYQGNCVGMVRRSIHNKVFKNTIDLPKRDTLWNIDKAKAYGDVVIVVESCIDAMRVHQAGHKNVVALLGSGFTEEHAKQLMRAFERVVIFTDLDDEGRKFGRNIASMVNLDIYWAAYDDFNIYPADKKDAGDMTENEIRDCLRGAVSHWEYIDWQGLAS